MFPGKVIIGQQAAAVRIALQRFAVQRPIQLVFVHLHSEGLREFLKQVDPCIQIRGTVIAVHHSHRIPVRRAHDIDFRMYLF